MFSYLVDRQNGYLPFPIQITIKPLWRSFGQIFGFRFGRWIRKGKLEDSLTPLPSYPPPALFTHLPFSLFLCACYCRIRSRIKLIVVRYRKWSFRWSIVLITMPGSCVSWSTQRWKCALTLRCYSTSNVRILLFFHLFSRPLATFPHNHNHSPSFLPLAGLPPCPAFAWVVLAGWLSTGRTDDQHMNPLPNAKPRPFPSFQIIIITSSRNQNTNRNAISSVLYRHAIICHFPDAWFRVSVAWRHRGVAQVWRRLQSVEHAHLAKGRRWSTGT